MSRGRPATAPPIVKIPPIARPATQPPPARKPTAPLPADYGDSAPTRQPTTAPARRPPGRPAAIDEPTMQVGEHELSDIEEMTMVTSPPAFGGEPAPAGLSELGDYEPTTIEGGPPGAQHDDDGGPTTTRDPATGLPLVAAESSAHTAPLPHGEGRGRLRPAPPGSPAHPALSAKNPTPAVSALKQAKPSRRTPAQGSAALPGPSVLQAIVNAQSSEPMPTRQIRGVGGPSDGVPAAPLPDHASSTGMTNPDAGRGAIPPQVPVPAWPPPGANVLPQPPTYQQVPQASLPHNQLPPHLQPYANPPPMPEPGAPSNLPLGAPVQTPQPFLPYPSQPPTFTKQLTALEADEVPAHLRLDGGRPANWLLRALLALAIIGGGVAAGLLFLRSQDDAHPKASLLIDSIPHGATVLVDGKQLPDPTPVAFNGTEAGARHQIELRLKGKKTWSDTIVVPAAGGEVQVKPFLQSLSVTLHVTSTPPGAEVYFNDDDDHPQGRTPLDVPNLDPSAVRQVKLKLAGYAPEIRAVDFANAPEQTVDATLHK